MSQKIFITRRIPEVGLKMLAGKGYEITVSPKDRPLSQRELIKFLKKGNYDGVLSLLTDLVDSKVFDAAPSVKIFANYAVGFNNIDSAEAKKRGIVVTNTPGGLTESVAEHTFALILSAARNIPYAHASLTAGKWERSKFIGSELHGKSLGLAGFGRIGKEVGKRALAFEMKVLGHDIRDVGFPLVSKEELLRQSDFVVLASDLNQVSTHLISTAEFSLMKPSAFLFNTARGPIVDEAALVQALEHKIIAGAGLDVFEVEPLPADSPLRQMTNVVLTPHNAYNTVEAENYVHDNTMNNLVKGLNALSKTS